MRVKTGAMGRTDFWSVAEGGDFDRQDMYDLGSDPDSGRFWYVFEVRRERGRVEDGSAPPFILHVLNLIDKGEIPDTDFVIELR